MRALLFDGKLNLENNYQSPSIRPGEALIAVRRAGICNTDLEITRGYMAFQGVLGHEFVGTVREVGSPEDAQWIGKRVVGDINAACGECETCRANRPTHCPNRTTLGIFQHDGAFADYLRLPVRNLVAVPDSVPDRQAVFVEPLAAACEILQQIHVHPTDRVMVVGDGKLGLLVSQVLRLTGAEVGMLGHHPEKGEIVAKLGVKYYMQPRLELTGCDVVVECTGNAAGLERAKSLLRPRGTLVLKSTYHGEPSIPLSIYVVDEINIVGSRCGPFAPAVRLLERGLIQVEPLISAEFSLNEGLAAFDAAFGKGNIKVLLDMQA
ncbi:MAG TPA: alcohol dehydrogenase catalytic domain-containing protein [Chloroflexia bacterium]|nr:alcohol dehydrogenase catalytic domain-containing protein [Chloroflexia bacterium]